MLIVPKQYAEDRTYSLDTEVRRAIADHFAKYGRDCEIKWIGPANCFVAMVSLKQNDPMLASVQKGERMVTEDVFFHEPNPNAGKAVRDFNGNLLRNEPPYKPLELNSMGPSAVTEWLQKRDVWSGRGEFTSLTEMVRKNNEVGDAGRVKVRETQRAHEIDKAMDKRRQIFKIPFLRVGKDLKQPPNTAA